MRWAFWHVDQPRRVADSFQIRKELHGDVLAAICINRRLNRYQNVPKDMDILDATTISGGYSNVERLDEVIGGVTGLCGAWTSGSEHSRNENNSAEKQRDELASY